tara:strand:- start:10387 stop:10758 length:372 start_codon:yes stop_codon:yes gene_type:complete
MRKPKIVIGGKKVPRTLKNQQMTRLMRVAGFGRVSDEASNEFGKIVEVFAIKLAMSAKKTMDTGGRKTPKKGDFNSAWHRQVKFMGGAQIDVNDARDYDIEIDSVQKPIKKVKKDEKEVKKAN